MSQFRKKPVIIEAILFAPSNPSEFKEVADWCGGERRGFGNPWHLAYIEIPTLEGTMRANYGDWIIKGVQGEFYPCKPDIFQMTYEGVSTESPNEKTERDELRRALSFAQSVIKTGEPWTSTCEEIIGGALKRSHPPSTN